MAIDNFQILFDIPFATYVKGQQVTGNVILKLQEEERCRAIQIRFKGEAKVHWTESSGDDTNHYSANEIYIDNSVYLVGGANTEVTIPPGEHRYPFKLILPADICLPSSFESTYGHVRYTVKAEICRSWKSDHKCKAAFTVSNPLDLNNYPSLQEPVNITREKTLCCGCCSSPITLVASLPFVGFVPGQSGRAVFELDNATSNAIVVRACIVQVITYTSTGGSKHTARKNIIDEKIANVNPRGSITSSVTLIIPSLTNSYLHDCKCIDISYIYEIRGVISGPHRDIVAGIPIVIGSIPFRTQSPSIAPGESTENRRPNISHAASSNQGSTSSISTPNTLLHYSEMPPPTYEECVSGRSNIQNEEDHERV